MKRNLLSIAILLLALTPVAQVPFVAQDKAPEPSVIELKDCLVLPSVGRGSRSPVHTDALEALMLQGKFTPPKAGDKVKRANGTEVEWAPATADDKGWVSDEAYAGAYAFWNVSSPRDCIAILKARGHSIVYANGELHYGDPYNYGYVDLPVSLKEGANDFLFLMGRGSVKASLELVGQPDGTVTIGEDWTLPHFVVGEPAGGAKLAAVNVINATRQELELVPMVRAVEPAKPNDNYAGNARRVPPMSMRKLEFNIPVLEQISAQDYRFALTLVPKTGNSMPLSDAAASVEFTIKAVEPDQARRVTFRSAIDGSVQYYGLRPAVPLAGATDKPGIVLSLHGASVEAIGQARAYSPKSWCHIVCPTNRRPFGFDWEDWGRLDALEVLAHAQSTLENDPTKVWLTGHSMGGHGTWTIGAHFPDKFAAIGPSAGWESFYSYAGGVEIEATDPVIELLKRTANASRTLLHKYNYKQQAVYILHGDADNNVPVSEARNIRDVLKEFHTDLQYFEQPGAGHWWDDKHDEGADCLDWRPMFDTFARRRLPRDNEVQAVDFTTVCPEHSAEDHWLRVEMQQQQLAPSRVQLESYPNRGVLVGTTENVARLSIDVSTAIRPCETFTVQLDGGELKGIAWPDSGRIHLQRVDDAWQVVEVASLRLKGPHRYGWFKNSLNHNFMLVYGTCGNAEENAWSFAKARFDAEQWWYRGNGGCDIVADTDFDPKRYPDRGVILYGNADTNSAFRGLLGESPVQLRRGSLSVGERKFTGDDYSLVFTYPRADSDFASVAVVGGSGLRGMKVTNRIGYFISGASFPDVLVYGANTIETGLDGVLGGGYFGEDWGIESGDFAWRD